MRTSSISFPSAFSLSFSMNKFWAIFCLLIVAATIISARPTSNNRHKRQSDQRLAELETLLALQKYNGHRVRGWQSHNDLSPAFGLIDFDKIGRRKKSTRFSPGEPQADEENVWNSWVSKSVDPRNPPTLDSQLDRK